jgi:phage-related protein
MNYLKLILITFVISALCGCGSKDKYDLGAEQVKAKPKFVIEPAGDNSAPTIELNGSEGGAITIPKGTKLPDGKVASEDTKFKVSSDNVILDAKSGTASPVKK